MKVSTCEKCPYSPDDLGKFYDMNSTEFCCISCHDLPLALVVENEESERMREHLRKYWRAYRERTKAKKKREYVGFLKGTNRKYEYSI